MGDILELIKSRRNIKYFLPKYVSWEKIAHVIDAGRHAPSCGNIQNWKFVVVYEPHQKKSLADACYDQYEIIQAGALIVVCGEPEKAERYYSLRGERLYSIQNCAAAIQNMLLEAHSLGLGTRWIGAFDEEAIKSVLSIPEEVRPQAIIALGYAKEIPSKPSKYPLESIIYFQKWRNQMRDPAKYLNDIATITGRKIESAKETAEETKKKVLSKTKSFSKKIHTRIRDKVKQKIKEKLNKRKSEK
tara:strand:+ start:823 stop:1557 length:735 start_codon:yes stop_codon:yes gene_type:complete